MEWEDITGPHKGGRYPEHNVHLSGHQDLIDASVEVGLASQAERRDVCDAGKPDEYWWTVTVYGPNRPTLESAKRAAEDFCQTARQLFGEQ